MYRHYSRAQREVGTLARQIYPRRAEKSDPKRGCFGLFLPGGRRCARCACTVRALSRLAHAPSLLVPGLCRACAVASEAGAAAAAAAAGCGGGEMAAAVLAAPEGGSAVMPAGNAAACPPPPGSSGPGSWSRSLDRALEEAAASGTLSLSGRKLRDYPRASAANHDLSDTTQAGEGRGFGAGGGGEMAGKRGRGDPLPSPHKRLRVGGSRCGGAWGLPIREGLGAAGCPHPRGQGGGGGQPAPR